MTAGLQSVEEPDAATRPVAWPAPRDLPTLGTADAHVWRIDVATHEPDVDSLATLLDPAEALRAARFHFREDRTRFVVAHGLLRVLLGAYTMQDPRDVRFEVGPFGKPRLAQPSPVVAFNMSDTRGVVLVGITHGHELGVDIEAWAEMTDHASVAEAFFGAAERAELRALEPAAMTEGFFACWTRKEAYIKATGLGVSAGLDYFDVSLAPDRPARLLADRRDARATSTWTLHALDVGPGYSGALVTRREISRISCFTLGRTLAKGGLHDGGTRTRDG